MGPAKVVQAPGGCWQLHASHRAVGIPFVAGPQGWMGGRQRHQKRQLSREPRTGIASAVSGFVTVLAGIVVERVM